MTMTSFHMAIFSSFPESAPDAEGKIMSLSSGQLQKYVIKLPKGSVCSVEYRNYSG